mgnify:CR=1 FL=1|jgi:hypothetical protein
MNDMELCDKCGTYVPDANDAVLLEMAIGGVNSFALIFARSRHLLPVIAPDGTVVCVGSPSRAQYLEGQPRDQRTAYAYNPALERRIRTAYAALQEAAKEEHPPHA